MANNSAIEWTEATWNPVAGCTPVSPGCLNCYASTMSARLEAMGQEKYRGLTVLNNRRRVFNGKISFDHDALTIPLRRKKLTTFFVNSMSDLYHEDVPFEFIDKVHAVAALCPQHTFQILTKRPERAAEYHNDSRDSLGLKTDERVNADACHLHHLTKSNVMPEIKLGYRNSPVKSWPLPNVHLGTSVENQQCADDRIPHLLRCPAAVRFLSCEPLLGPVDLDGYIPKPKGWKWYPVECRHGHDACPICDRNPTSADAINWVIVGGESGPRSRPMNIEWARSIVQQCKAAGVPVFVKQMGAKVRMTFSEWQNNWQANTDKHGFTLDAPHASEGLWRGISKKGGDPAEWPEDLRVREMPHA